MAAGDPPTAEEVKLMNDLADAQSRVVKESSALGNPLDLAAAFIKKLGDAAASAGISIKNMNDMSQEQVEILSVVSSSLISARASFEGLDGVDTKGLITFKGQIDDISKALFSGGTLAEEAKNKILKMAREAKLPENMIEGALLKGGVALVGLAEKAAMSADNALKLQNAYVQLSAQGGRLGEVFEQAGDQMQNMNFLLANQSAKIAESTRQTGLSGDQLDKYWAQLGAIPGALQQMTMNLEGTSTSVNLLSTAVNLARGSGRDYSEIMKDMRAATVSYGLSIPQALTFTSRVGEISDKIKAPMTEVRAALLNNAEAFKMFAGSGESAARQSAGLTKIMEDYAGALIKAGVSSGNSIKLAEGMTKAISGLRIEQMAFLSQQSGGPGGLMGGFQIQKMLMEGKTDEVMKLVEKQMRSQMGGRIVGIDEASKSESAANQFNKQIMILQQGPLGKFAETMPEAINILKAFKEGITPVLGGGGFGVEQQIAKGEQLKNLATTPLSEVRSMLESTRYTVNIGNLSAIQRAGGALTGMATEDTVAKTHLRENLKAQTPASTEPTTLGHMATGNVKTVSDNFAGAIEWFGTLPKVLKDKLSGYSNALTGDKETANKEREKLQKEIDQSKTATPKMNEVDRMKAEQDIGLKQEALNRMSTTSMANAERSNAGAQVATAAAQAPAAVKSSNAEVVAQGGTVEAPGSRISNEKDINIVVSGEFVLKDSLGNIISDNAKSVSAAVK